MLRFIALLFLIATFTFASQAKGLSKEEKKIFREGLRYFDKEEYKKSFACFKNIVFTHDNSFDVVYYYGVSLYNTGKIDQSIFFLERAISLNYEAIPSAVYYDLAKYYVANGNLSKAEVYAQRAIDWSTPDDEFVEEYYVFHENFVDRSGSDSLAIIFKDVPKKKKTRRN